MADRHNSCVNPACANDVAEWGGNGAAPTRTAVTGFDRGFAARYSDGTFVRTAYGAASPTLTYTLSVYVRTATFGFAGTAYIEWQDASHGALSYTGAGFTVSGAGVITRISVTDTAPASTAFAALIVGNETFSINNMDATQLLIEQAATVEDYFDGDSTNGSWDGTPGNSASTLSDAAAVTGTLDTTLPALVAAAEAALTTSGTVASTLPALTAAAAASLTVAGAAHATLPPMAASAAATLTITGTAASTLPPITAATTGALTVTAAQASTLPALTAQADATLTVAGSITTTLPAMIAAATGTIPVTGTLATTLPALVAAFAGTSDAVPEDHDISPRVGAPERGWAASAPTRTWAAGPPYI